LACSKARLGSQAHLLPPLPREAKNALAKKIALEGTQATDLHPLAKKIAALLPDHETLTLSQIVKLTKGKPSTVKLRLKELVEKGYLVPKGQGRGAHYLTIQK
jgi:Fic family protein